MKCYIIMCTLSLVSSVTFCMKRPSQPEADLPAHVASAEGDSEALRALTERKSPSVILGYLSSKDAWGRTPLHWAAAKGHDTIVSYIIVTLQGCYGTDEDAVTNIIKTKDNMGKNASELTAENGYDDIVGNIEYSLEPTEAPASQTENVHLQNQTLATNIEIRIDPMVAITIPPAQQPTCFSSCYDCLNKYLARTLVSVFLVMIIGMELMHQYSRADEVD